MKKKMLILATSINTDGGIGACLRNLLEFLVEENRFDITIKFTHFDSIKLCNNLFPSIKSEFLATPEQQSISKIIKNICKFKLHFSNIKDYISQRKIKYGYKTQFVNNFISKINADNSCYDIAISYSQIPTLLTSYLAHKVNAKTKIAWVHNTIDQDVLSDINSKYRIRDLNLYKNTIDCFNAFVCVSNGVAVSITKYFNINKNKIFIINNFINNKLKIDSNLKKFSVDNKIQLLTAGRVDLFKGIDRAIDVACILKKNGIDFVWHFIGYNFIKTMPLRKKLKFKIHHLAENLKFYGNVNQPFDFYLNKSDIYVHVARIEGYPTVLVEAKISGCPIVTTNVPGACEIIENGYNGFIFDNLLDLSNKIIELSKNKNELLRISNNNLQTDILKINSAVKYKLNYLFEYLDC